MVARIATYQTNHENGQYNNFGHCNSSRHVQRDFYVRNGVKQNLALHYIIRQIPNNLYVINEDKTYLSTPVTMKTGNKTLWYDHITYDVLTYFYYIGLLIHSENLMIPFVLLE